MGEAAKPSPTVALNAGIQASRGRNLALMIDGAHVLTPRRAALRHVRRCAPTSPPWWPPSSGTWGRASRVTSQQAGYDQGVEDRLFKSIGWPVDGYRLFEISHFIGERDWFDGILESNCLFVPRSLLEQLGAFDDSFDMAGGGYANLDLFERLGADAGRHRRQHPRRGHASTRSTAATPPTWPTRPIRRERVKSYGEHFRDLRGRRLLGASTGRCTSSAPWPRRRPAAPGPAGRCSLGFDATRRARPASGRAAAPRGAQARRHRGDVGPGGLARRHVARPARQPLPHRPARVPGAGHRDPARTRRRDRRRSRARRPGPLRWPRSPSGRRRRRRGRRRAARRRAPRPRPRSPTWSGSAQDPEVVGPRSPRSPATSPAPSCCSALGDARSARSPPSSQYAPLVPVGGYVVVENTVVNGRPAAPGFGPGPHEAAVEDPRGATATSWSTLAPSATR